MRVGSVRDVTSQGVVPHEGAVDLIVIGGGLGGLAAAARGADLGLRVLVLEKSAFLGGVGAYSGGFVWAGNNHLMAAAGVPDDHAAVLDYLDFVRAGLPHDAELLEALVRTAPEAVEYLVEGAGVQFELMEIPDQYYPAAPGSREFGRFLEARFDANVLGEFQGRVRESPHFEIGLTHSEQIRLGGRSAHAEVSRIAAHRRAQGIWTHGRALSGALLEAVLRRDVQVVCGVSASRIRVESGRVTGVIVVTERGPQEILARRGVVIATGSYGSRQDVAAFENVPDLVEASPPGLDGDHLGLAADAGAAVVRAGDAFTVLGYGLEGETHPGSDTPFYRQAFESAGFPHSIIVNRSGRRFGNEASYGSLVSGVRAFDPVTMGYPNLPCYLVVDAEFTERYPLGPIVPGDPWPASIVSAPTLDGLATSVGIDPAGLRQTVEEFNASVRAGVDGRFGRGDHEYTRRLYGDSTYPNPNLGTIARAPFRAIPLRLMGVGIYSVGLRIDGDARVLRADGTPVPGLYATGNAVAYTEQPRYAGGHGNARNLTFGFIAAGSAAKD